MKMTFNFILTQLLPQPRFLLVERLTEMKMTFNFKTAQGHLEKKRFALQVASAFHPP